MDAVYSSPDGPLTVLGHMVLLYWMPVLEAMLDQGSRERSRDWAWRYSL